MHDTGVADYTVNGRDYVWNTPIDVHHISGHTPNKTLSTHGFNVKSANLNHCRLGSILLSSWVSLRQVSQLFTGISHSRVWPCCHFAEKGAVRAVTLSEDGAAKSQEVAGVQRCATSHCLRGIPLADGDCQRDWRVGDSPLRSRNQFAIKFEVMSVTSSFQCVMFDYMVLAHA